MALTKTPIPGRPGRYMVPASELRAAEARASKRVKRQGRRVAKAGGLAAYIKKVVKQTQETKYVSTTILNRVSFNGSISSVAEVYPVIPAIVEGTDNNERVGEKIAPSKCRVDFAMGFGSADTISRDITAHVFMLRSKSIKATRLVSSIPITNLLDDGGSNTTAFNGTLLNAMLPVSKENFTVLHHRKIHLQKTANDDFGVGSQNLNRSSRFSLTYKPKALVYDKTLDANYPENDFIFFVIGYVYNSPDRPVDALPWLEVSAVSHMYYKDG